MKQFLSVDDVPDINALLDKAALFKKDPRKYPEAGKGKRLGCVFLNPSMRTRISTVAAAANLGLETIVFNAGSDGWQLEFNEDAVMNGSTVEHVKDAAPVMGKYFDILGLRTFPGLVNKQEDYSEKYLQQFVKYSGIPVISLESATLHPLQSLADLLTITENYRGSKKPKVVLCWAPHVRPLPQCVANSFAQWMNAWGGSEFVITHPPGYELHEDYTNGASITHNQAEALEGADFIYVKNWSAYHDYGALPGNHMDWMLRPEMLSGAPSARIMHCLPVRRNIEISGALLDSGASIVTEQAGNRLWAAQAVLASILKS